MTDASAADAGVKTMWLRQHPRKPPHSSHQRYGRRAQTRGQNNAVTTPTPANRLTLARYLAPPKTHFGFASAAAKQSDPTA